MVRFNQAPQVRWVPLCIPAPNLLSGPSLVHELNIPRFRGNRDGTVPNTHTHGTDGDAATYALQLDHNLSDLRIAF